MHQLILIKGYLFIIPTKKGYLFVLSKKNLSVFFCFDKNKFKKDIITNLNQSRKFNLNG
jgi:hypothetical protein